MKNMILSISLLLFATLSAHAQSSIWNCDNLSNGDDHLTVQIDGAKLTYGACEFVDCDARPLPLTGNLNTLLSTSATQQFDLQTIDANSPTQMLITNAATSQMEVQLGVYLYSHCTQSAY